MTGNLDFDIGLVPYPIQVPRDIQQVTVVKAGFNGLHGMGDNHRFHPCHKRVFQTELKVGIVATCKDLATAAQQ